MLIKIWDEGVGYKQQFCRAALLGHGPSPFTAYMCLTSGCAPHTTLPKEHSQSAEQACEKGWLIYPEAEANA